MNKRHFLVLILIICLESLVIGYLLYDKINSPKFPIDVPPITITKDSIIRDSIYIVNEKIKREIVYIKEQYKQDSIDIMSANDSVLFDSFSRYIEDYDNK